MPEYVIQHNYSNGADLAFTAGQTVDLDDATAAWLEHDSPGVLGGTAPAIEPREVDEPEVLDEGVHDAPVTEVDEPEVLDEGVHDAPVTEVDEPAKAKRTRAKA